MGQPDAARDKGYPAAQPVGGAVASSHTGSVAGLASSMGNAAFAGLARQVAGAVAAPPAPGAAPMEIITSGTQAELTTDYFTARIVALMNERHIGFAAAAREIARANLTAPAEHATRSGSLGAPDPLADPPVRRAVAISVAHYHGVDRDLPVVAEHLGPRGIATRALQQDFGVANARVVRDPSAAGIRAELTRAVTELGAEAAGRPAELTVIFEGHGDASGIEGSDGRMFTLRDLQAQSNVASNLGVQLVVISDSCLQGAATVIAEQLASRGLRRRVDSAALPEQTAASMRATLAHADELIQFARVLTPVLESLASMAHHHRHDSGETREIFDELRLRLSMLNAWNPQVERGFTAATPALNGRIRSIWRRVREGSPGDRRALVALLPDLDWISDHLIEEVAQLHELVQTGLDVSTP